MYQITVVLYLPHDSVLVLYEGIRPVIPPPHRMRHIWRGGGDAPVTHSVGHGLFALWTSTRD